MRKFESEGIVVGKRTAFMVEKLLPSLLDIKNRRGWLDNRSKLAIDINWREIVSETRESIYIHGRKNSLPQAAWIGGMEDNHWLTASFLEAGRLGCKAHGR